MGSNFHTPWTTSTKFRASEMAPPIDALDLAITYCRPAIVHCDGQIAYDASTGSLSWSGTLRILFSREDGDAVENTVAAGSVTLSDGRMAYVTLSETTGTALTVSTALVSTGSASGFLAYNRLVLAYRNTSSNECFPVALRPHLNDRRPVTGSETSAATITVDLDDYDVCDITLDQNAQIDFTGGRDGQEVTLRILQDATGSRAPTWGTMVRFSTDTPSPTLSTAADTLDYLRFRYNSTDGKYDCMSANRGF